MRKIVVCIKPVPDPTHWGRMKMDEGSGTLKREGIPIIMNPLDKHAIEASLVLREERGGEIVLISMAPSSAVSILREGLAMGADRAVLLADPLFAGSDTLATARVLAAGCRFIQDVDLIFVGNQSIDSATGQICSQLGELLGLPSVMHVIGLESENKGGMIVTQKIEGGYTRLRAGIPIVLALRREVNKPRHIPFSGILASERKEIRVLSSTDLDMAPGLVGLEGSPTKMAGVETRRLERPCERVKGSAREIAEIITARIHEYGII